ncbi:hypothetical protein K9M18_00215 [Candidatus Woesearchaeota archaeon]|nr:hypothetical protein [Candidatus Woesearchaeota archaeon]MCF8012950.1 hypothetical protein [Candidatus Woesearchaeota archaeon]
MKKTIILIMILILIFLAGCTSTKYICYNGLETKNIKECTVYPTITLNEIKASRAVDNYGRGYVVGKDITFTRVNTYVQGGDWYSDVLFSERNTGSVAEVKLKIDGRTSSITCIDGCEAIGIQTPTDNETIKKD